MSVLAHRTVRTNGIDMHVAEQGDGPLVVLCHGWPELWYSWRHQVPALAGAGYRGIAPDMRGYGRTDCPERIEDYDIFHLTGDLVGLLDAIGEEKAVFVGHDWGAIVCWQLALMAPERVRAVVGMSVAFVPRGSQPPTQAFRQMFGDTFFYILYFQKPGLADEELARDPYKTLARTYSAISGDASEFAWRMLPREGTGFLDAMRDPTELPPWLTAEDLSYFVDEFTRTGFTGGLNWYRNFDRNWELTEHLAGAKVTAPALFVAGERDPVLRMIPPDLGEPHLGDLRGKLILPGAGHWVQQERPEEVNRALLDFLAGLPD